MATAISGIALLAILALVLFGVVQVVIGALGYTSVEGGTVNGRTIVTKREHRLNHLSLMRATQVFGLAALILVLDVVAHIIGAL